MSLDGIVKHQLASECIADVSILPQLQPRLFEAGCVQAYDGKKTTYARNIAKSMSLELAFQPKDGKCANHLTQGWCTKTDYDSQPYELCTPGK